MTSCAFTPLDIEKNAHSGTDCVYVFMCLLRVFNVQRCKKVDTASRSPGRRRSVEIKGCALDFARPSCSCCACCFFCAPHACSLREEPLHESRNCLRLSARGSRSWQPPILRGRGGPRRAIRGSSPGFRRLRASRIGRPGARPLCASWRRRPESSVLTGTAS